MNSIHRLTEPEQPLVRLVCFPHAGGTASSFQPWKDAVPLDVELWAVQYPGRHDRLAEACPTSVSELVDDVLPSFDQAPRLPTVLFGHSLGAAIAYECARRLPDSPALVVLSARRGPGRANEEALSDLNDADFLDRLARLGGLSPQILGNRQLLEIVLPALRADCLLSDAYSPDPDRPISAPILACVGDRDPSVTVDDILAWRSATVGAFTHQVYPGDHFYLQEHKAALVRAACDAAALVQLHRTPTPSSGRLQ
ncbi:thioesterase II family protein [Streptomyces sp. NPDC002078]